MSVYDLKEGGLDYEIIIDQPWWGSESKAINAAGSNRGSEWNIDSSTAGGYIWQSDNGAG